MASVDAGQSRTSEDIWVTSPQPAPLKPTEMARLNAAGNFHYVLHFQQPASPRPNSNATCGERCAVFIATRCRWRRSRSGRRRACSVQRAVVCSIRLPDGPLGKYMTEADLNVYVKAFEKIGFRGGLNWYRNIDRNWEESANLPDRVDQPSLMITAELDFVLWPEQTLGMERWVPNLKRVNIKGSGHWTQQEKPAEVNAALLEFLSDLR